MKEAIMCTKSVERRAVQLTIKCQVKAFELLMNYSKPGEGRVGSKGVSSKLTPSAVWVLEVFPNGDVDQRKGNLSVFLHLTGPALHRLQKNKKEYLEASYHLYLIGRPGCTTKDDTIARNLQNFGEEPFNCGSYISHERVKEALQENGSLVVVADICYLVPSDVDDDDGGEEANCEECALRGNETQERSRVKTSSEPHSDNPSSDWTIEVGVRVGLPDGALQVSLALQVEKRSIRKALNARNVIAMAVHADADSNSFDTCSAELLKQACLELIDREWDAVCESAEWKHLQEDMPELATDLALEATTLTDAQFAADLTKEARMK